MELYVGKTQTFKVVLKSTWCSFYSFTLLGLRPINVKLFVASPDSVDYPLFIYSCVSFPVDTMSDNARNTLLVLICMNTGDSVKSPVIVRYRYPLCKIYSTRISIHALEF